MLIESVKETKDSLMSQTWRKCSEHQKYGNEGHSGSAIKRRSSLLQQWTCVSFTHIALKHRKHETKFSVVFNLLKKKYVHHNNNNNNKGL